MAKEYINLKEAEDLLKRIGAPSYAIHGLALAPKYDVVHQSCYDQCAWERDLAIRQLRDDYGVGLGEKKSADVVEVVRCRDCKHWNKDALACDLLPWVDSSEHENWYAEDFCSYGERRDT